MKLDTFEVVEPIPALNEPHALAVNTSWMDAGHAATLIFSRLEALYGGTKLASLTRPGDFFDFTRLRPAVSRKDGATRIDVPNATASYISIEGGRDLILLRLPEPNAHAETYVESVVALLKHFGVQRYGLLGSFYDMVPYTRPILISGTASNEILKNELEAARVAESDYEGPTSILSLITQQTAREGIENFSMVAHLPGYLTPEEDYRGVLRLTEALQTFYELPAPAEDAEKAREQEEQLKETAEQYLEQQPQLKLVLKQLENNYDARFNKEQTETRLSPEIEKFLKELNGRFGQGS